MKTNRIEVYIMIKIISNFRVIIIITLLMIKPKETSVEIGDGQIVSFKLLVLFHINFVNSQNLLRKGDFYFTNKDI